MQRQSNIELLRIVLMIMIVFWHYICHGMHYNLEETYQQGNVDLLWWLVYPLVCYKVNCFVFVSGYFGINLTAKRFISFVVQLLLYSAITYTIYWVIIGGHPIPSLLTASSLKSIIRGRWWFANAYVFLMLVAPLLNEGAKVISKRALEAIIIGMLIFSVSGLSYWSRSDIQTIPLCITIYLIGRYLRLYPISHLKKYASITWAMSVILLVLWNVVSYRSGHFSAQRWMFLNSNASPLNIVAAVAFFYMFDNMSIPCNRAINTIASGVWAAYLVTDGFLRDSYNNMILTISNGSTALLGGCAIMSVLTIAMFDIGLRRLCEYIGKCNKETDSPIKD